MYIPNGINTNGIKCSYFTGINCNISKLICNYSNILQLYTNSITVNGNISVSGNINLIGNINITGDINVNGNTHLGTTLIYSSNNLSDVSGAISLNEIVTWLDASGGDIFPTLPTAPEDNLLKIITLKENSFSNTATVQLESPGTFLDTSGSTVATFENIGQSLTLLSVGDKWAILSNYGDVQLSIN